jgi:hypothetical protein
MASIELLAQLYIGHGKSGHLSHTHLPIHPVHHLVLSKYNLLTKNWARYWGHGGTGYVPAGDHVSFKGAS